ncbi:hypothetical protein LNQ81_13805 [Myroides sp. M-43]|uniref:hypothetical protein n=1 Tax=Myroides oncorhynchi TaxID=2893756 RepID=UPI001E2D3427|nr:hypothetical protein [Myroides oncorhynchi]MCC9043749.1 hypothetical protein [Myroides oncorhynchi]
MKKSIVVLMLGIGGVIYAQDSIALRDLSTKDTLKLRDVTYVLDTYVLNDSLDIVEKRSAMPAIHTPLNNRLKYIASTDEGFKPFISLDSKKDSIVLVSKYIKGELENGVVVEDNGAEDLAVVHYTDFKPVTRYTTNSDYHFYMYASSEIEKNDGLRDQFDNLEEGELLPYKQDYVDGKWTSWNGDLTVSQVNIDGLSTAATLYSSLDENKERMMWKILDKDNVLSYVFIEKAKGITTVYEQSFRKEGDKLVPLPLNTASMINVGFDKKRITTKTEKGKSISDIYFETFGKREWKKPNQYIFDYKRKSDKKDTRARVVLDKSITPDTIFFDFIVALANNPELFRRDVHLKDFSYEQLLNKKIIVLNTSVKALYILE